MKVLQWGHRLVAVESAQAAGRAPEAGQASMGPPLGSGGINRAYRAEGASRRASMGPPLGSGGILLACTVRPLYRRFNGATARSRWTLTDGHAQNIRRSASMGPPLGSGGIPFTLDDAEALLRLQWGHRLVAVESFVRNGEDSAPPRFNGATAW